MKRWQLIRMGERWLAVVDEATTFFFWRCLLGCQSGGLPSNFNNQYNPNGPAHNIERNTQDLTICALKYSAF
jgi:hypothetical protein